MGYCVYMDESTLKFKKEYIRPMLETIEHYLRHGGSLRWVDKFELDDIEDDDYTEVWDNLRYGIELEGDYYRIYDFYGEKYGDDLKLFDLIASYLEDGYIEFHSEDGDRFRIVIYEGQAFERYPELVWK